MAQQILYKGIKFDSKIEYEMYLFLEHEKFRFDYQKEIQISESIKKDLHYPLLSFSGIQGKKVTPDFSIHFDNGIIILLDTKGFYKKTIDTPAGKKEIKHKYADHIRYKYEILRRWLWLSDLMNFVVFIVDEYHIGRFKSDLIKYRNEEIKLTEIVNQY